MLAGEGESRNLVGRALVWDALPYLEPETGLVVDREFSFAEWLEEAGARHAIRLDAKARVYLEEGGGGFLWGLPGEGGESLLEGVSYRTQGATQAHEVNRVRVWAPGQKKLLNLPPEELLCAYQERMTRANAGKTLRLLAFAYALGLLVEETLRERWQGKKGGFRSRWREALREALGLWPRRLLPPALVGT